MPEGIGWAALWLAAVVPSLYLAVYRRRVPSAYWLVALGFLVSWWAEVPSIVFDVDWPVTHYYPPVQIGLWGLAFGTLWIAIGAVALAAITPISTTGPEVWVTLFGSVAVLWVSRGHVLRRPLIVYCGVASVFYLLLAWELGRVGVSDLAYGFSYAYQSARVVAFGLFIHAAHRWREA